MTKALLIDSANRRVIVIEVGSLEDMQAAVGGNIEPAFDWSNGDGLYVDEEGLLKPQAHFFRVNGRDEPLAGNGLVAGCDAKGETVDVKSSADEIASQITFLTRAQVDSWAKGNASEPAIVITTFDEHDHPVKEVIGRMGRLYGDIPRPEEET